MLASGVSAALPSGASEARRTVDVSAISATSPNPRSRLSGCPNGQPSRLRGDGMGKRWKIALWRGSDSSGLVNGLFSDGAIRWRRALDRLVALGGAGIFRLDLPAIGDHAA